MELVHDVHFPEFPQPECEQETFESLSRDISDVLELFCDILLTTRPGLCLVWTNPPPHDPPKPPRPPGGICCQQELRKLLYCSYFYKLPLCDSRCNQCQVERAQSAGMRGIFHTHAIHLSLSLSLCTTALARAHLLYCTSQERQTEREGSLTFDPSQDVGQKLTG